MLNSDAMNLPPADLSYLRERFKELATLVREYCETTSLQSEDSEATVMLRDAMLQLVDMLDQIQENPEKTKATPNELTTLGEYGLHLIEDLGQLAVENEQADLYREIEHLSLPFALWIARHGGEIRNLAPVVNSIAHFANQNSQPHTMASLYTCCCEVIEAISPTCENPSSSDPNDPWRLLLLNRAIVATRSHNQELMEPAYDAIVESLPEDAERFFSEGMEQMTIIEYPNHVREIMKRYYLAHTRPKRLH